MVAGEFGRDTGDDLLDDRPHFEGGPARVQAVAEEGSGLLDDDLIDGPSVPQFRAAAFGLIESSSTSQKAYNCVSMVAARAIDEGLRDFLRHVVVVFGENLR